MTKLIPGKDAQKENQPWYLEEHLLNTPYIAIQSAIKEITRMTKITNCMIQSTYQAIVEKNPKYIEEILKQEELVDKLQDAITNYLSILIRKDLGEKESQMVPSLIHIVNDAENLGDQAVNLMELAEQRIRNDLIFSDTALEELEEMHNQITLMLNEAIQALPRNNHDLAHTMLEREKKINDMNIKFKIAHTLRLQKGKCKQESGITFIDILDEYEKIGDHLTNIAQAILGKLNINNE